MEKTFLINRDHWKIIGIVISLLVFIGLAAYGLQKFVESDVYITPPLQQKSAITNTKEQYEIAKIYSEIRQIRSDTGGSLFWLKLIALFVTVGGAVSGYLIGQSRATRSREEFEGRRRVDAAYQSIVQELSAKSPLLRAAASAKLGLILESFPEEWNISEKKDENINKKNQLNDLTKKILAASLSIEKDKSVLKNLTKSIALHSFSIDKLDNLKKDSSFDNDKEFSEWFNSIVKLKIENNEYCDLQKIDLSSVNASDAYWANIDFTLADFHKAILRIASFRNSILIDARFREADLQNAVFVNAFCRKANFMLADLRYTDFSGAKLSGALFDRAKVFGVIISSQTVFADNPDKEVDNSENGDGSEMIFFKDWLSLKINEFEKPS